jgi:hypothetical protein
MRIGAVEIKTSNSNGGERMNAWISANLVSIAATLMFALVIYFDLKKKAVPSILGTGIILILAVVNYQNIAFGLIMLVYGWLMYEAGMFKGMADIKMFAAIGLLVSAPLGVIALIIVITVYGAIYNALIRGVLKVEEDYAGTLPIFLSFLTVWLSGGLG